VHAGYTSMRTTVRLDGHEATWHGTSCLGDHRRATRSSASVTRGISSATGCNQATNVDSRRQLWRRYTAPTASTYSIIDVCIGLLLQAPSKSTSGFYFKHHRHLHRALTPSIDIYVRLLRQTRSTSTSGPYSKHRHLRRASTSSTIDIYIGRRAVCPSLPGSYGKGGSIPLNDMWKIGKVR
jgi:hypothetical protein